MAVSSVIGNSNAFNNQYATQGAAEANNSEMSMDDFWQLMAAQLQYQDMTNPMSNSEMMNQMTQMNQAQLLHWINMVSFAVVDITEYLDTHPIDAEAICYFNHHIEMRRNAMQVYADKFGPLTIDTANPDAYWDWAKQPLPWEGGGC